jgi:hypothetical protein
MPFPPPLSGGKDAGTEEKESTPNPRGLLKMVKNSSGKLQPRFSLTTTTNSNTIGAEGLVDRRSI